MKGIRSLFRLGALAMVAVLLVVALTVPAAAADQTCKKDQMLDEVVILSVTPLESAFTWDASELLSYGDGAAGTYPTGQLAVEFNDINTAHSITHYDVIATPSDDPGTSDALGIGEVTTQVNRPSSVGSVVTATLDLEPGTNYDIDVVAFYYSVQISSNQSNQDSLGATTFLSPPFLGGGVSETIMTSSALSPSGDGVHFLVYKQNQELHTLRWLNPQIFGPFDHQWKPGKVGEEGADILCTDKDGDLQDDCADGDGVGITHYRVTVIDDNGNTEYTHDIATHDGPFYTAEFNLNDGTYTFAVDAGYVDGDNFYPLSDKVQVEFDIPDDYTKYNQETREVVSLLNDIVETVRKEDEDFDAFYDSDWNYEGYTADGLDPKLTEIDTVPPVPAAGADEEEELTTTRNNVIAANESSRQHALTIYLNNLYN